MKVTQDFFLEALGDYRLALRLPDLQMYMALRFMRATSSENDSNIRSDSEQIASRIMSVSDHPHFKAFDIWYDDNNDKSAEQVSGHTAISGWLEPKYLRSV